MTNSPIRLEGNGDVAMEGMESPLGKRKLFETEEEENNNNNGITSVKTEAEKHTEFMSHEEATLRNKKLKGYQYVPDIPQEDAPLPLKRERKKVQYNDFIDAPSAATASAPAIPTNNNIAVAVSHKKSPTTNNSNGNDNSNNNNNTSTPRKRIKLDDEVIKSLNEKKRELEKKLSLLNQDLAEISEKLNSKSIKRQSERTVKAESKYSELSDDDDDDETYTKKSKSRKTVRGGRRKSTPQPKKKQSSKSATSEPRPKRNARKSFPDYTSEASSLSSFAACKKVLALLMSHRYSFPFLQPVDYVALKIPDYPLVITHPMDFGTIKTNLDKGNYESVDEFIENVNLVFDNACTYNPPGSDVYIMAQTLREIFLAKLPDALETSGDIAHTPTRASYRAPAPILHRPPVIPVNPEYSELKKSVDSIKKELQQLLNDKKAVITAAAATVVEKEEPLPMTREEKKRLSHDINNLASEHLTVIVKIIKQKMSISESSDEIVIDIDALDTSTLRELELYVQKVKKRKGSRRGPGRPTGGQKTTTPMDKLEQAKKTEEVTAQKMQDVKRRLEELSHKTATRNGIKNNTSFSLANQDLRLETDVPEVGPGTADDANSSASESESDSGSESGSDSDSDSDSESESESENDSDAEKK